MFSGRVVTVDIKKGLSSNIRWLMSYPDVVADARKVL
jgi:hypothetical protein